MKRLIGLAQASILSILVVVLVGTLAPTGVVQVRGRMLQGLVGTYNPAKVISTGSNNNYYTGPPNWGHNTSFNLKVLDTQGNADGDGQPRESFSGLVETNDAKLKAALANPPPAPPGPPSTWPMGCGSDPNKFVDHNDWYINYDSGATTFWYSFKQTWIVQNTGLAGDPFTLNTHTITHKQNGATRQ